MTDLHYLSQADGAGDWREKEAKDLSDLVQNRISYLQVHVLGSRGSCEKKELKRENKESVGETTEAGRV